jgi:hypothetical protein
MPQFPCHFPIALEVKVIIKSGIKQVPAHKQTVRR